jgi:hypothetical protein
MDPVVTGGLIGIGGTLLGVGAQVAWSWTIFEGEVASVRVLPTAAV